LHRTVRELAPQTIPSDVRIDGYGVLIILINLYPEKGKVMFNKRPRPIELIPGNLVGKISGTEGRQARVVKRQPSADAIAVKLQMHRRFQGDTEHITPETQVGGIGTHQEGSRWQRVVGGRHLPRPLRIA